MKPSLLICIPTIKGREEYLDAAVKGYRERTPEAFVILAVVHDYPTAGMGWQRAVEVALKRSQPDYIHFGNDDVVVAEGWFPPLKEAIDRDCIPAPRVEPGKHHEDRLGMSETPLEPPERTDSSFWYADLPEMQPKNDWDELDHGAFPTCSLEQWKKIGPFIPIHFGTDKWFYYKAKQAGYKVVARMDSVIFNYAAEAGRNKGEWTEIDFLDFDLVIALPQYISGYLSPTEPHPLRMTPEGLQKTRNWRKQNLPGPYHWEE